MYRKNTAGQFIGFVAINASTGATMTGTTGFAAFRVIDGGAQAAATGTVTDKGNGQYSFALSQADTNGNDISILFTMTSMLAVEKTFITTACDPTTAASFGITNLDATVSSRSTYAGGAVASVTAGVTLAASQHVIVDSGTVSTLTNLPAIPANWLTAAGIAASALNGKGDWLLSSSYTTPPTVAAIATGVWQDSTAGDFTTASSIGKSLYNAFTSNTSVFTTASLVNAPTGGSAPTAAAIATAVWQDTTAGDFNVASSIGKSLYNAFTSNTSVFTTASLATVPTGGSAPSAASIATAVWQDATAGDFTVASSIGKALYIANVAPGAAGGHFIAGTNAATTITGSLTTTFTGNLTGSVASVTAAVTLDKTQALSAARALDAVADTSLTVNDALHAAIASAAGKETVVGTAYAVKTPSTGTVIRTFTLDSGSAPTSRS